MTGAAPAAHEEIMGTLRVERIATVAELEALGDAWRSLHEAHGAGVPFCGFDWCSAWWAHLRADELAVRDALYVRAFREDSGRLVGVAPLMLTQRPSRGPLRVRAVEPFGADPNVTEIRTVLCDPAHEAQVYAALLADLRDRAGEWDWMSWPVVREGSPGDAAVSAERGVRPVGAYPNFVLPLPASWEEFKATRSRNVKESLRKCYNSLKRDGHAFTLEVATSPPDVRRAVERFLFLHRARAELGGTTTHANVFEAPAAARFLHDVCDRLAARGAVRVFGLRIGGEVVATRIGFVSGGSLYLYFSGFDPAWGKYSVMTTTVAEAMRHAIGEGLRSVNLSNGADISKTRWGPEAITYRELVQVSPSRRAAVAYRAYQGLSSPRVRGLLRRAVGRAGAGG